MAGIQDFGVHNPSLQTAEHVESLIKRLVRPNAPRLSEVSATLERVLPATGTTRAANITGLDYVGLPVWSMVRPCARSISIASGKGLSSELAYVSGMAEAIELYCAENYTTVADIGTATRVGAAQGIADPSMLPRARDASKHYLDVELRWAPGRNLVADKEVLLPFDLVHADFRVLTQQSSDGFLTSTNGLGAGHNQEEAILHALCEVIERDAVGLSFLGLGARGNGQLVDLESLATLGQLSVAPLRSAGLQVRVWNITTNLEIPCYCCCVEEGENAPHALAPPAYGAGCHPCADVAVMRAVLEAAQSRLALINGARDDIVDRHYDGGQRAPSSPTCEPVPFDPGAGTEDLGLEKTLRDLSDHGIEQVISVDLSLPRFPLAVARVVVPGLEGMPFSRRYQPGRRAMAALEQSE